MTFFNQSRLITKEPNKLYITIIVLGMKRGCLIYHDFKFIAKQIQANLSVSMVCVNCSDFSLGFHSVLIAILKCCVCRSRERAV